MLDSQQKRGPSLQLVPPLTSHVKDNIMDLGWFPAKFSRPRFAFLTLHAVSYLAGLMSLHSSNGPTPACELFFFFFCWWSPFLEKSMFWKRQRIRPLQHYRSKVSALLSLLEHANHFCLAISEEIHKKLLSAGLQMFLLLLQGSRAAQIVTLNWGNWWKETEKQKRNKSKRSAEFIQETHALFSKEKGMSKSHPSPARRSQHHLRALCWRDDRL